MPYGEADGAVRISRESCSIDTVEQPFVQGLSRVRDIKIQSHCSRRPPGFVKAMAPGWDGVTTRLKQSDGPETAASSSMSRSMDFVGVNANRCPASRFYPESP